LQERKTTRVGDLLLDPAQERATVGEEELVLGRAEFDVLFFLAENAGQVVSSETLRSEVWKQEAQPKGNAVDVCVHRLRRKLANTPYGSGIIRTVRGKGYVLEIPRK
jgi:DNA-binding response OmpR family regulator